MNKDALKERLLKIENKLIAKAELNYHEFLTDNKLDSSEVEDVDDHSHQIANEEMTEIFDRQITEHREHLNQIKHLSFAPTDEIVLGAVVKINGKYFVVAVAEPKFEFEGKEFMGISVSAPIYNQLRGKKAGNEFIFNKKKFKIEEVY